MAQLLCHLFGDYVLQNHFMANLKVKSWFWALLHAAVYTACFLVLTRHLLALVVIFGTHAVIDRYRLAGWWVQFYGIGEQGFLWEEVRWRNRCRAKGSYADYETRFPVPPDAPDFLKVWLHIIVDNTWHLAINALCLAYL